MKRYLARTLIKMVCASLLVLALAGGWKVARAATAIARTPGSVERLWGGNDLDIKLAGIRVRRLDGVANTPGAPADSLDLGSLPFAVIFVFDPHCGPTNANMANWTDLVREAPPGAPLYSLSYRQRDLGPVLRYWDGMHARVQTLGTDTATLVRRLGVGGTPTTLLVRNGKIRHSWKGFLMPQARAQLLHELSPPGVVTRLP
jgi:hypothetical protein